jgi:hypothetical protein
MFAAFRVMNEESSTSAQFLSHGASGTRTSRSLGTFVSHSNITINNGTVAITATDTDERDHVLHGRFGGTSTLYVTLDDETETSGSGGGSLNTTDSPIGVMQRPGSATSAVGRFYGGATIQRALTANEITGVKKWFSNRCDTDIGIVFGTPVHFAEDGATWPLYALYNDPCGVYSVDKGLTFLGWEAWKPTASHAPRATRTKQASGHQTSRRASTG